MTDFSILNLMLSPRSVIVLKCVIFKRSIGSSLLRLACMGWSAANAPSFNKVGPLLAAAVKQGCSNQHGSLHSIPFI